MCVVWDDPGRYAISLSTRMGKEGCGIRMIDGRVKPHTNNNVCVEREMISALLGADFHGGGKM